MPNIPVSEKSVVPPIDTATTLNAEQTSGRAIVTDAEKQRLKFQSSLEPLNKAPIGPAKRVEYGCRKSSYGQVSSAYMVKVESKLRTHADNTDTIVHGILQDKIEMTVEGLWEAIPTVDLSEFIDAKFAVTLGKYGELAVQGTGTSTKTLYNSRRMWMGSTPVEMNLVLKFEAITDAYKEVYMACMALQQLALPGQISIGASFGAGLVAPGPSPVWGNLWLGDNITVSIGTFLKFSKVVVKEVRIEFSNRLTEQGIPVGAVATLKCQTYEIQTKTSIKDIYSGGIAVGTK